ncbi:serine/threonine-protein kinase [Nostoc sp. 'Lobaria pulmonaria (5183) cyanobiont']|uniref:serine/threonine-protein kinase n=1 Tax=Nostoc sp. 'Lobaria pulmonaria (5183) cyanobiont' TaxID=1618022 RepID=UPI000CF32FD8|nr:serine/threonine-protein kinase [Nostoc sp. 'Lobaria pulmonaria (5183) cyanobiont']AVH69873.1 WD40 repeat-containing serine/threonine protein kinase [Nostoc sp. 'Lobaria pulmonaria (5183) cyanobiont']
MLLQERYRLIKQIGKGGFCKTFLAVDEGEFPPVPCLVQELSPEYETSITFEQKAQQLEELGKHPQIPALLNYFQQKGHFYLVQEFIAGTNLAQMVEEEGAFNEIQIWQLLEDVLPVFQFMSDRNIIHRDIKPQNIIRRSPITKKGDFVIVDFTTAKIFTEIDRLRSQTSIGSPEYAAPEQTKGKAVFASDLYSLGVTCIYLLTQIPPFDLFDIANDCWVWQQYLTTKVSDVWRQDSKSLRLVQILDKLLQNAVNRRFQSADEVMQVMGMECKTQNLKIQNSPWQCLHTLTGHSGTLNSVNALAISPDGYTLASASDDKNIKLWDLNTKKVLASLSGHTHAVKSVTFSPNGQILATASDDKTIKLWQVETLEEICTLLGHAHAVKSVAFSPDGQILASGSWDKTIKLWDVNTGREICTIGGHQLKVNSVAFSPQGQLLASASYDRTIRLWQIPALGSSQREFENRPCYSLLGTLSGHAWAVLTVAFSPDGQILATGSDDNTIKLWEVNTGQLICTLVGHSWSVVAVAFTADGETLLSASCDKTVKLWRVSTAEEIVTLSGHVDSVSAVAVSKVTQLIASGSRDKTIKLWQLVDRDNS